jgi:alcohol dehydrogenase
MSAEKRHRPRGWVRHVAGLLTPSSATALHLALERGRDLRVQRARAGLADGLRERVRPRRSRMRTLVVAPGGRFSWRSVPTPPGPGPLEAIVHPIAVATCDLDRALALGATPFPLPLRFGHECVAEVLSIGEQVTQVAPGRRVVVPFQISCGTCPQCRWGHTGNCANVPPFSMYGFGVGGGHWGGAFSDQLLVPYADQMLVPLPDELDPAAAASVADNVCDAYRHIAPHLPELLQRDPEAEVLIVAGVTRRPVHSASIPLYAGLVARAMGARTVHLADTRASVRGNAGRLGLGTLHPADLTSRLLAPLVIDATAHPRGHRLALSHTAPDGVCSSVGALHVRARIPVGVMYARNVDFRVGRTHARTHIPRVLELMAQGLLRPESVTTTVAALDDAPSSLHDHMMGDSTKTILVS